MTRHGCAQEGRIIAHASALVLVVLDDVFAI